MKKVVHLHASQLDETQFAEKSGRARDESPALQSMRAAANCPFSRPLSLSEL